MTEEGEGAEVGHRSGHGDSSSARVTSGGAAAASMPNEPARERPRAANKCFVCGPDNPIGLHLAFRLEDGECRSEFTPGENHQGYPGVIHGGMLYSVLDDVMANWLYLQGARAYTARCEIRYKRPAREGEKLTLIGRPTARKRKLVEMEGVATRASDGKVVATAAATFVVIDETEFAGVAAG